MLGPRSVAVIQATLLVENRFREPLLSVVVRPIPAARTESAYSSAMVPRICQSAAAILALISWVLAEAQAPIPEREFAAILSALGLEAEPAGLTSVQFFDGRDGGRLDLPPQAAGSALCSMERHYFLFDDSSGYSRFLEPQYLYWRRAEGQDCVVGSLAQIPTEKTYANPAISIDQLTAIITRTEELVALARPFPKCEGMTRFFRIMERPLYIERLERSGSSDSEFVATLAPAGVYAGAEVTFSLAGNEFVPRRVCAVNWSPFGYEEVISTFTRP